MTQNRSSAVMQQRKEPHDSLDFFPTPPWATRALCEHLKMYGPIASETVWEPACGEGHMARPLAEYFREVRSSDVHPYRYVRERGFLHDFLGLVPPPHELKPDWIITNPPFRLAEEIALRAFEEAKSGVALLVRTAFLEGIGRHERLFLPHPPSDVLQFAERVPMVKGRIEQAATTATAYCWLVWELPDSGLDRPRFRWLAPCRARLEKATDYEEGVAA